MSEKLIKIGAVVITILWLGAICVSVAVVKDIKKARVEHTKNS